MDEGHSSKNKEKSLFDLPLLKFTKSIIGRMDDFLSRRYPERTESEKNLLSCMMQLMVAILSCVSCISIWIEFNAMVCFTLMIPVVLACLVDALCARTVRRKLFEYILTILTSIALIIIITILRYDTTELSSVIMDVTKVLSLAAPLKSIEVFVYKAISTRILEEQQ